MERTEVLDLMGALKLYGMKAAYDETLAAALKRKHEPQRFVGDLLKAEISEKQARSIKYQLTVAKLPLAKDVDDFAFKNTPINEALVRDLAAGGFLAQQRNLVLVGGTGTGKTHLAIAIARSCIRSGSRGRFFTTVDLVNRLEAEAPAGRQGRIADYLTRMDFVVLDELGYLPFAQAGVEINTRKDWPNEFNWLQRPVVGAAGRNDFFPRALHGEPLRGAGRSPRAWRPESARSRV